MLRKCRCTAITSTVLMPGEPGTGSAYSVLRIGAAKNKIREPIVTKLSDRTELD